MTDPNTILDAQRAVLTRMLPEDVVRAHIEPHLLTPDALQHMFSTQPECALECIRTSVVSFRKKKGPNLASGSVQRAWMALSLLEQQDLLYHAQIPLRKQEPGSPGAHIMAEAILLFVATAPRKVKRLFPFPYLATPEQCRQLCVKLMTWVTRGVDVVMDGTRAVRMTVRHIRYVRWTIRFCIVMQPSAETLCDIVRECGGVFRMDMLSKVGLWLRSQDADQLEVVMRACIETAAAACHQKQRRSVPTLTQMLSRDFPKMLKAALWNNVASYEHIFKAIREWGPYLVNTLLHVTDITESICQKPFWRVVPNISATFMFILRVATVKNVKNDDTFLHMLTVCNICVHRWRMDVGDLAQYVESNAMMNTPDGGFMKMLPILFPNPAMYAARLGYWKLDDVYCATLKDPVTALRASAYMRCCTVDDLAADLVCPLERARSLGHAIECAKCAPAALRWCLMLKVRHVRRSEGRAAALQYVRDTIDVILPLSGDQQSYAYYDLVCFLLWWLRQRAGADITELRKRADAWLDDWEMQNLEFGGPTRSWEVVANARRYRSA